MAFKVEQKVKDRVYVYEVVCYWGKSIISL